MIEDIYTDFSTTNGRPIFCHFLNRELHDSLGNEFNGDLYTRHLQYLSITNTEPMFCNVSQIFEASSTHVPLINEIKELAQGGLFYAHSEYFRIKEFLESRQNLYSHDTERYPIYFNSPPKNVHSIKLRNFGNEGSTTGYIEQNIRAWDPLNQSQTATKLIQPNDKLILAPHASKIQNVTSKRGDLGLTIALFRQQSPDVLSDPMVDGGLRRLLSALYVSHYCDEFNAVRSWGLPSISYFDDGYRLPLLNNILLSTLINLTGLNSFLSAQDGYGIRDRIDQFFSFEKKIFSIHAKDFSDALKMAFFSSDQKHEILGGFSRAIQSIHAFSDNTWSERVPKTYKDALSEATFRIQTISHKLSESNEGFREAMEVNRCTTPKIIIATATDLEDKVLFQIFEENGIRKVGSDYSGISSIRHFGEHGGVTVFHVRSSAGSTGSSGAQETITDALNHVGAHMIISAGICFGLNESKQELGDIAVSSKVRLYEQQRINETRWPFSKPNINLRGDLIPASALLLDRMREKRQGWDRCSIHEGVFLSGEKLVDNKHFVKQLKYIEPEAVAGEMEGSGVSSVGVRNRKDWIVIKGICDWGHGKERSFQNVAAKNTFQFVTEVIKSGGLNSKSVLK